MKEFLHSHDFCQCLRSRGGGNRSSGIKASAQLVVVHFTGQVFVLLNIQVFTVNIRSDANNVDMEGKKEEN